MKLKKRCKKLTGLIGIIMACCTLSILFLPHANAAVQADKQKISKWAKQICADLGVMSLGTMNMGVNTVALGMVMENGSSDLRQMGFTFGEGSYRIHAMRIDTGRYLVSVQAMSRPDDNYKKVIHLKTKADTIYPVSIPKAPAGKYMWNSAIQFDMEDQLGIRPDSEMEQKAVSFVNFRVVDPSKFEALGITGYKNKATTQMSYKKNNTWKFNFANVTAVYENGQWSTNGSGSAAVPSSKPAQSENKLLFLRITAGETTYNKAPFDWDVFEGRVNDRLYYLVCNPEFGKALIDINKNTMLDAELASELDGGEKMALNINNLTPIPSSGSKQDASDAGKTVHAWWENETLSFVPGGAQPSSSEPASAPVVSAAAKETVPEGSIHAPGLLFANSDFEMGNLTNWTAKGNAFDFQPTKGDNPIARGRRGHSSKHQGQFWIGTFEKYQGQAKQSPGGRQGDRPKGTLTSIPFKITGDKIAFLVGGGESKGREMVSLLVDGKPVLNAIGERHETLKPVVWDVSSYKGKNARILIKDLHTGGWGHINADNFHYPE